MKPFSPHPLSSFVLCLLSAVLLSTVRSHAGGVVTVADEAHLRAALMGGGTVTFAVDGTITLTSTFAMTNDTLVDASGHSVTLDGGGAVRLFQVNSNVTFSVEGLALVSGRAFGTNGAPGVNGQDGYGAGILNLGGTLVLNACRLIGHRAQGGDGGALANAVLVNGGGGLGAAICSLGGTLNLTNCMLAANVSAGGLGASSFPDSTTGNSGAAMGAGIYADTTAVNLDHVTLAGNQALGGATGSSQFGSSVGRGGDGIGAGLYATSCVLQVTGCMVASNTAAGGGVLWWTLGAYGPGGGSGLGAGIFVSEGSSALISLTSFTSNSATGGPGVTYAPSGLASGGAIFNAGQLEINASSFANNQSSGGPRSLNAGTGRGGAISSTSALTCTGCTFDSDRAIGGTTVEIHAASQSSGGSGEGGAVWSAGSLLATNCTFTANEADGGVGASAFYGSGGAGSGGAVLVSAGTATLVNVTIAGNRADGGVFASNPPGASEGGGLATTNTSVTVHNSIIANSANGGDTWGTIIDAGYNICSDGTANFTSVGSLNNVDPQLSALSFNGGPTATMSLLASSPARDRIPAGFPPTDQRGIPRPQGNEADIGAFEADYLPSPPQVVTQPQGNHVRFGAEVTFTVGATGSSPLSYQWLKDGNLIAGATTSILQLTNVQPTDQATYSVGVTNSLGGTVSQGAFLFVDSMPLILSQPASVVVAAGASTNFTVAADGPGLLYQWRHEGAPINGATNSMLLISSASGGEQGNYYVVVANFAGSIRSETVTLVFDASALSIAVPPSSQTIGAGLPVSFSVSATGVPPIYYQWQFNGIPIPGATGSVYSIAAVQPSHAGTYTVLVTNAYRSLSASAELSVTPGAAPPLLSLGRLGNFLTITFSAEANRTYRLLASTNLNSWSPVATNSAISAGVVQFVQPITGNLQTFFRVTTP